MQSVEQLFQLNKIKYGFEHVELKIVWDENQCSVYLFTTINERVNNWKTKKLFDFDRFFEYPIG